MKPKLLLLSDLWGREKGDWIKDYLEQLLLYFDCQYYDCCELGEVDKSVYTQERLHQQFVNGGIDKAVEKLLKLEQAEVFVLAFSIGGTIAWKAAFNGLKIKYLWAVSATRLRYERECPNLPIYLFFGQEDTYRPQQMWLEKMNVPSIIFPNQFHDFYTDADLAKSVTLHLVSWTNF